MKDAIQEGRRGMATESKTRHRLLAVDDDETIRTMLKDFFEGAGYAVDTAANVPEALEKLSQEYHVVLSDISMPEVSGIDCLQQAHRVNPALGIFLITAYPTPGDPDRRQAARRRGLFPETVEPDGESTPACGRILGEVMRDPS